MKLHYTAFTICLLLFGLSASPVFAQTEFKTDDPVEYSEFIVKEQARIGQQFVEFSQQLLSSGDYKANDQKRVEVVREIELSLRRLRNMAPFKGGTQLRGEAIAVFDHYKELHSNEYARIAVLVTNKESSLQALEDYFEMQVQAEKKMRSYAQRIRKAQKKFADKHRLTIVKNPMQDQFNKMLEANIYSREVFLAYIAVAKVNEAWWNAMGENNFEEMKKQRVELIKACDASTLGSKAAFDGNSDFRDIAKKRVDYYRKLGIKEYKEIREALENPQRTQEDVDYLNEIIENYNKDNAEMNNQFNEANRQLKLRALPQQQGGK